MVWVNRIMRHLKKHGKTSMDTSKTTIACFSVLLVAVGGRSCRHELLSTYTVLLRAIFIVRFIFKR